METPILWNRTCIVQLFFVIRRYQGWGVGRKFTTPTPTPKIFKATTPTPTPMNFKATTPTPDSDSYEFQGYDSDSRLRLL